MGLDMAKYRRIFLEESADHLAEISRALLALEKEMASVEAIDTIFRMAHSIKSMAASLGYEGVSDLSHRIEDRMEGIRRDGRVRSHDELSLLFQGLETLEAMVEAIGEEADPIAASPELLEGLAAEQSEESPVPVPPPEVVAAAAAASPPEAVGGEPKKVLI